jgi:hypothetical protein
MDGWSRIELDVASRSAEVATAAVTATATAVVVARLH